MSSLNQNVIRHKIGLLTDAQVAALERKQDDELAHGEIETAHPSYLGSHDTFYVGTTRALAGSTGRPLLIPTAGAPWPSSTRPRRRSLRLTC